MVNQGLHSIPTEQSLLCALMLDNSSWIKISGFINEDDFFDVDNRCVFLAIKSCIADNKEFDFIIINDELEKTNKQPANAQSWFAYVGKIVRDTPTAANILTYAKTVKNYSAMRQMFEISQGIVDTPINRKEKAEDILIGVIQRYSKVLSGLTTEKGDGIVHIKKLLGLAIEKIEAMYVSDGADTGYLLTPWADFNEKWGGFPIVGSIGIGGRPGSGKTTAMQNFIEFFATRPENKGKPVIIFSMDMHPEEVAIRILSSFSKVSIKKLSTGKLEEDDFPKLTAALVLLNDAEIYIDGSSLTVHSFQAKVERFIEEIGKPAVIAVDYLQLMTIPEMKSNPFGMLEEISKQVKELQKKWGVLLIELLQLNRSLESRPNKRPLMSDIRGAGQIEQDLEAIYFLYRDEMYNEDSSDKGVVEVIGGKVRKGEVGTVRLVSANLGCSRFENYAYGDNVEDD